MIAFSSSRARRGRLGETCRVVAGPVSAHGYCLAFTPKPNKAELAGRY